MKKPIIKMIYGILFLIVSACSDPFDTPPDKNIFVIIGQSNASSKAFTDERLSNDKIWVLNLDGEWVISSQAVNRYSTLYPEYTTEETNVVYSFGYSFGLEYIQENDGNIYFISNARGSTGIDYWSKGGLGYEEIMPLILPFKDNIKAILFHQGEGNSRTPDLWLNMTTQMVSDFRADLGVQVPFIFGQISQNFMPHFDNFNVRIYDIIGMVPLSAVASSNGVTTIDDNVHFDVLGQIAMGESFYSEYISNF